MGKSIPGRYICHADVSYWTLSYNLPSPVIHFLPSLETCPSMTKWTNWAEAHGPSQRRSLHVFYKKKCKEKRKSRFQTRFKYTNIARLITHLTSSFLDRLQFHAKRSFYLRLSVCDVWRAWSGWTIQTWAFRWQSAERTSSFSKYSVKHRVWKNAQASKPTWKLAAEIESVHTQISYSVLVTSRSRHNRSHYRSCPSVRLAISYGLLIVCPHCLYI